MPLIDYVLWLQKNESQFFPNAILISALQEQWNPIAWRDGYLELPMLESTGAKIGECRSSSVGV